MWCNWTRLDSGALTSSLSLALHKIVRTGVLPLVAWGKNPPTSCTRYWLVDSYWVPLWYMVANHTAGTLVGTLIAGIPHWFGASAVINASWSGCLARWASVPGAPSKNWKELPLLPLLLLLFFFIQDPVSLLSVLASYLLPTPSSPGTCLVTNPQRINRVSTRHRNTPPKTTPRTGPGPDSRPAADCTLARNGKTKDSPTTATCPAPDSRLDVEQQGAQLSQSNEGLPIELAQWFDKERQNPSDTISQRYTTFIIVRPPHNHLFKRFASPLLPVADPRNSNDSHLQHVRVCGSTHSCTPFDREALPSCGRRPL